VAENPDIDDVYFESRFINVLDKPKHPLYQEIYAFYGESRVVHNGLDPRTKYEIYNGMKCVDSRGLQIDSYIINLPFTVMKNGKPAETAFVDRPLPRRHIHLVPDHTPTRILTDISFHKEGYERLVERSELAKNIADKWIEAMESKLSIGERVAASIMHEYGHILSFRAWDRLGFTARIDLYDWFDEYGYIDNVSHRIVSFSQEHADIQINTCIEQLAEDFRLAQDVKSEQDVCCLPHIISYEQDSINPEKFLEGADIMTKLLTLNGKGNMEENRARAKEDAALDRVIPFGEANRSAVPARFRNGGITPITEADKKRAREQLKSKK
jgi:hypothetical protein